MISILSATPTDCLKKKYACQFCFSAEKNFLRFSIFISARILVSAIENRQVIKHKGMYWVWCLKVLGMKPESTGYILGIYWVYTGYEAWKYWVILLFELLDTLRCFWSWCFCQIVVLVGCFPIHGVKTTTRGFASKQRNNLRSWGARAVRLTQKYGTETGRTFSQWRYQNGRNGYRAKPSLLRSVENAEFLRRDWHFDFRSF